MFNLEISFLDLSIVIVYMLFAILIGVWIGRSQRNVADYFLGGRSLPWFALLLSIVATETSTVTFLSIPGIAFAQGGDLRFLQIALGYIVGRSAVALFLLPLYFRGELFTSYEVLQTRFGPASRRLASLLFIITRTVADALRLFLTAIVLREVVNLELSTCVILVGIATISYTFLGGMRSVVWNDCIQFVVYMLGAVWALNVLVGKLPGGWPELLDYAAAGDKFRLWDFSLSPLSKTMTFWIGLVGGAFLTLGTHGTDQLTVQRLLSAPRQRDAAWALIGSSIVVAVQFALFLIIGVGLACFYAQQSPPVLFEARDEVFATFIVRELPLGVVGITLAAVFSAAMSTLSSSLNASANAAINDFYRPLARRELSERHLLRAGQLATVVFGILQMAIAILSEAWMKDRSAVDQVLKIAGFTTGPILGLFFLAAWPRRVSSAAALGGFAAGLFLLTVTACELSSVGRFHLEFRADGISGYYYSFIGSVTTFVAGLAYDFAQRLLKKQESAEPK